MAVSIPALALRGLEVSHPTPGKPSPTRANSLHIPGLLRHSHPRSLRPSRRYASSRRRALSHQLPGLRRNIPARDLDRRARSGLRIGIGRRGDGGAGCAGNPVHVCRWRCMSLFSSLLIRHLPLQL